MLILRNRYLVAAVFIAFLGLAGLACAQAPTQVPGRLIVKFKQEITLKGLHTGIESIDRLGLKYGLVAIKPFFVRKDKNGVIEERYPQRAKRAAQGAAMPEGLTQIYALQFSTQVDITQVLAEYEKDPAIEYAQGDYIVNIQK